MISDDKSDYLHVAVGVILNSQQQVLIAKRPRHLHQGGLWEFPGGKVENQETVHQALTRELQEELAIQVSISRPLITIPYAYSDKRVYLDVHIIDNFSGVALGQEGQEIRWVNITELAQYDFPEANRAILTAIQLPDRYLITGKFENSKQCETKIHSAIQKGIGLIQLRQKELPASEFLTIANKLADLVESSATKLILNTSLDLFAQTHADGIHFTGGRLRACEQRPVADDKLFSVSTHTHEELQHAVDIGADFAMLSPVLPTQSHPGEPALGWDDFTRIINQVPIPVYALGGMTEDLIPLAREMGAQGIAAISALWNEL